MEMTLNHDLRVAMSTNVRYVEELLVDERKGVPQTKYIVEIPEDSTYWDPVKEDFVPYAKEVIGFWMMKYSCDLRYTSVQKAFVEFDDWVRCEKRQVVVNQWVEV